MVKVLVYCFNCGWVVSIWAVLAENFEWWPWNCCLLLGLDEDAGWVTVPQVEDELSKGISNAMEPILWVVVDKGYDGKGEMEPGDVGK